MKESKFKIDFKNRKVLLIAICLLLVIGVSLAFFVAQISDGISSNFNVSSDTTDDLRFEVDKEIDLNPTQFNVLEGGSGLSDTAVGSAILRANSTQNTATYNYYVYFQINSNNYVYTTSDSKPEIVLTVTNPAGEEVTSIAGLTHVTATNADGSQVTGFDITTKSGLFNVASLYEITSNSSTAETKQDWTFKVTFINLTTNQSENGGKSLNAEIILSRNVYTSPDVTVAAFTA